MLAWETLSLGTLLLVLLLFVWQTLRHEQWHWLWFSVALWLVLGWFSGSLMPRLLGITHLPNAFLLHAYVFLGSVFFWLNNIQRLPETGQYWQSRNGAVFLTLLCVASLLIHGVFAVFALLIMWAYPAGWSVYVGAFLAQIYFSEPLIIWVMHGLLMAVFYLHRRIQQQRGDVFNLAQLEVGALLLMFWLTAVLYQRVQLLLQR